MNILIVAPYVTFHDEQETNRFITIEKKISKKYNIKISIIKKFF